jgi:GntR family transcriptional regulator / MocR family aminotransferase
VRAGEDTIVITCGTQHAIDLIARVLLEPGDTVVVEDPGYLPVARLFAALGATVAGVPVDDQGAARPPRRPVHEGDQAHAHRAMARQQ